MHPPEKNDGPPRMERRAAIKWMLAAAASITLADRAGFAASAPPAAAGYGTDPDLTKSYSPGDLWPLTLTPEQRRTTASLCDLIIPADAESPSASDVGVVDFIDEWISAPYPMHREDRTMIIDGLRWLDQEAQDRFGSSFDRLDSAQSRRICDEICHAARAKPSHLAAARFFTRFRDLTTGGFYTTPEGMKDLNYIGNIPLATFNGPSRASLRQAGLV